MRLRTCAAAVFPALLQASAPATKAFVAATFEEAAGTRSFAWTQTGSVGKPAIRIVRGSHPLAASDPSAFLLGSEGKAAFLEEDLRARAARGPAASEEGFFRTTLLDKETALVLARAARGKGGDLRLFGLAMKTAEPIAPAASLRLGSFYPLGPAGEQLDAFWIRDAEPAPEELPSGGGLSIAGAGDRPRRFFRGHRFRPGKGCVASVRFADPSGGSLRLSVALPSIGGGPRVLPSAGVSVAVTELAPDLDAGRTSESVTGLVELEPLEGGRARLRLSLEANLRLVGGHDPQTLLIFGEIFCVGLQLDRLTPWLGRFSEGRPVLEPFAAPGDDDR